MDANKSPLEKRRLQHKVQIPSLLQDLNTICFTPSAELPCAPDVHSLFPGLSAHSLLKAEKKQESPPSNPKLHIGVFFSGGPAPGGHNVIAGLMDALKKTAPQGILYGFLKGPEGLLSGSHLELTPAIVDPYRNLGGFDLLGSSRTKIESKAQMQLALGVCQKLALDGLVVIGGDDSNTNAAVLANFFL